MDDGDLLYVPDDAICPRCSQFVPNHDGLERYLAANGIRYYDVATGLVVTPMGNVRYCRCPEVETARPRYSE